MEAMPFVDEQRPSKLFYIKNDHLALEKRSPGQNFKKILELHFIFIMRNIID
jgi:hypothetical protein